MQDGLTGIVRPASVENALRNLNGAAGFIRKHVSSTGNRNWYELTAKGRRS
jgi:DNA-binding PadR family transcriptional regulator